MCSCQIKGIGRKKSTNMAKKKVRRRRSIRGLSKQGLTGVATSMALGAVGAFVTGKILEQVLPASASQYSNYVTIGAGLLGASMSNNASVKAACLGAATVGGFRVVQDLADGQAGVSLLPPGRPQYGIAGTGNAEVVMS